MARPSPPHIEHFEALVESHLGFECHIAQRDGLAKVLATRIQATGCNGADEYYALLRNPALAAAELPYLADELSVSESYFFRGMDHWRAIIDNVLPQLARKHGATRRLRILSAGCAAGEEAYTLAILLQEQLPELHGWEIEIIGIDNSPRVLDKARRGGYTAWILRNTPASIKERYFQPVGTEFKLVESIRQKVRFEQRNLLDQDDAFWHASAFDLILCRNVFIYFSPTTMREVIHRFSRALTSEGFLFLGHSENLRGVSRAFHLCSHDDTFYYQLRHPDDPPDVDPWFDLWRRDGQSSAVTEPPPYVPDDSWVATTQQISERIARLTATTDPDSVSVNRAGRQQAVPQRNEPDWQRVMALYAQEQYATVEQLLEVPAAAGDPDALLLLAAVFTNRGQIERAEETCRTLLAADEFNAGAHYLFALCREHGGDIAGAESRLQSAVYLDSRFAMPHLQLGRLARRAGRIEVARRHFSEALGLLIREDTSRLLLFSGGFSREMLSQICRDELAACGGAG